MLVHEIFLKARRAWWHGDCFCCSIICVVVILLGASGYAYAGDAMQTGPKQARPVLGWSSWSYVRKDPTHDVIMAQANALVHSGLAEAGYKYVNVDDFWYVCPGPKNGRAVGPAVDRFGRWVTDSTRFPGDGDTNGMASLAHDIHALGLKFGIYVTPGISRQAVAKNTRIKGTAYSARDIAKPSVEELNYNCKGMVAIDFSKPGAQSFIDSWAQEFASWGVDFIKLDGIKNSDTAEIEAWSKAISHSGRRMVLDVTQGQFTSVIAPTLEKYAGQWVVTPDIECYSCNEKSGTSFPLTSWEAIVQRFHYATVWQPYAVRGGYNDYDSIEVGNGAHTGLSPTERKTQLSLWALEAAPLILGVDLTRLDSDDLALLTKRSIIAVDQDGIAARRILDPDNYRPNWNDLVFAKTEPDGSVVVGLFNMGSKTSTVSVSAIALGLPENKRGYTLENLWTDSTSTSDGVIDASVPSHGVVLYRVRVTDRGH